MSLTEILLLVFYGALFSFIIWKSKFFDRFSISKKILVLLFLLRAVTGIFYGWIHLHFYKGGDTWVYFTDSRVVMSTLLTNPAMFLKLTFGINHRPAAP